MRIGYRRYAGKIGITDKETGTRGMWFEKRKALVQALETAGHTVEFVSKPTKASSSRIQPGEWQDADLLMVEFGSSNKRFYGADIELSEEMMAKKPFIFLLDDPDLWTPSASKAHQVWVNADPEACKARWNTPCKRMPFAALMKGQYTEPVYSKGVYMGGVTGGRQRKLQAFRQDFELDVLSAEEVPNKDELPTQPERRERYGYYLYSLGLTASLHKKLGWETGRISHSLLAGTPVVTDEPGTWATQVATIREAPQGVWTEQYTKHIANEAETARERIRAL